MIVIRRKIRLGVEGLSADQRKEIHNLFKSGFGAGTIARRINSKATTVAKYMKDNGLHRSRTEAMKAYNEAIQNES